jgi:endonuclease/exonuclease/phosphatase family metal-dependent hydrolase
VRPRVFLVLLVVIAFGCGPRPLTPRSPAPGEPWLRVTTYNLHFKAAGDPETLEAVGLANADVVCLQEVTPTWEGLLRTRYAHDYPYMDFKPASGARGLGLLSRYPIRDRGLLASPHDWHPAALADIETPQGTVQVLHVHLRAWVAPQRGIVWGFLRAGSDHEAQIRSFAAHLRPGPALVVGDFNESPSGAAIRWLERRGFRNALPAYHPGQPTWRGRSIGGAIDMTVDHVLFDAAFAPLEARVLQAGHSDHLPVVATLARRLPEGS